jgi:iron(III) transport system substrate-binding protein
MLTTLQILLAVAIGAAGLFLIDQLNKARTGATTGSLSANPRFSLLVSTLILVVISAAGCQAVAPASPAAEQPTASPASGKLTVYSGRTENLVAPVIEQFETESGIDVEVRYGGTAEMAATIMEEGVNSPADVFFAQDAGALGALANEGRLVTLPDSILSQVDAKYRSAVGNWVGVSGRARTVIYNTDSVQPDELPANVYGLTDPKWQGRVGWAPSNGSFQAFVTAMRKLDGDEKTRQWLLDMIANDVQMYDGNAAIVNAVGAGEIELGLVNHYYLYEFLKEQGESFPAANYFFPEAGAGSIVNVAGVGIVDSAPNPTAAEQFVNYLLSTDAQQFFIDQTVEYPLAGSDLALNPQLKPLAEIAAPDLDLSVLEDLQGTLEMLEETGALQ